MVLGALPLLRKVADDRKYEDSKSWQRLCETIFQTWKSRPSVFKSMRSSLESLVGGVIFEDGRHYTFVYENEDLVYEEEVL